MLKLPVIVGFGGINAAGRSSNFRAYERLVIDALTTQEADQTYRSLASLMNLSDPIDAQQKAFILANTLVREINAKYFSIDEVRWNKRVELRSLNGEPTIQFDLKNISLPFPVPENWRVTALDEKNSRIHVAGSMDGFLPSDRLVKVRAAGQIPAGCEPGKLYPSRNHPRGLQMTVFAASDALASMGIDWQSLQQHIRPDEISVYAGSAMGQLDMNGHGGMMMSRLNGRKVTSKHCPLGFAQMPADFINAYVLGGLGATGSNMGACASFLYNLRQAISDIQTGQSRFALVGSSEAPITAEIMDGYAAMGALATDPELLALDGRTSGQPDYRRACRPFSTNCGFTIAESAQFLVLMDDELALEMGAHIYGAASDVFVNADGYKKSISSPGVGNYITFAKACGSLKSLFGEDSLRHNSFVQAHGTGTPQNRVSESHILNEVAKSQGIEAWNVCAVKSYLGHSIGAAAGDQIMASLGVWKHGILPGISSIDHIAKDVHNSQLNMNMKHQELGTETMDAAIINAKGFGGNNATANILAPHRVKAMLEKRHGNKAMQAYAKRHEAVREKTDSTEEEMQQGLLPPLYRFDYHVLQGDDIKLSENMLAIKGYPAEISLDVESCYRDMV